jgi:aspartyl-tRNA(Asn)/glutamyl-tRNA(Gln) amidotransferase subunit C
MASKLTRADVLRVAALARLDLSEAEVDLFTAQLEQILGYASEIQKIDTTGVTPTSFAPAGAPAWRDDEPVASLNRDTMLEQAPGAARSVGLFKVPKVL